MNRKSKFWIFIFSLFPGAGQMYLGFMKLGVSLMGLFFLIIFLSSWLMIGPLVYLLPVLWFYAFFDSINKGYSDDQTFARYQDHWLFSADWFPRADQSLTQKGRLIVGILALLLGISLLWNNILSFLSWLLPNAIFSVLEDMTRMAPQLILGAVIVAAGVWLIMGGRRNRSGGDGHD